MATALLPTQLAKPADTAQALPSWLSYSASTTVTSVETTIITRIAYDRQGTAAPSLRLSTKTTTATSTLFSVVYRPLLYSGPQPAPPLGSLYTAFDTLAVSTTQTTSSRPRATTASRQSSSTTVGTQFSAESSRASSMGSSVTEATVPGAAYTPKSRQSTSASDSARLPSSTTKPSSTKGASGSATTSQQFPTSSSYQNDASRGRVAGLIVGSVVVLLLLAACLSLCARRKQRKRAFAERSVAGRHGDIETKPVLPSILFDPHAQRSKGHYAAVGIESPLSSPTKLSFADREGARTTLQRVLPSPHGEAESFLVVNGRRLRRQPYDPFHRVEQVEKTDETPTSALLWSTGSPRASQRKSLKSAMQLSDISESEERRSLMAFAENDTDQRPDNEIMPALHDLTSNDQDTSYLSSHFLSTAPDKAPGPSIAVVHKVPRVPVDRSDIAEGQLEDGDDREPNDGGFDASADSASSRAMNRNTFGADLDKMANSEAALAQEMHGHDYHRSGASSRNTVGAVTALESPVDVDSHEPSICSENSDGALQKPAKHSPASGGEEASGQRSLYRGAPSQYGAIPILLPATPPSNGLSSPLATQSSTLVTHPRNDKISPSRRSVSVSPRAASTSPSHDSRSPSMLAMSRQAPSVSDSSLASRRPLERPTDGRRSRVSESSNADSSSSGATFGAHSPDDMASRLATGVLGSALDNLSEGQEGSTIEHNNDFGTHSTVTSPSIERAQSPEQFSTTWRRFARAPGPRESPKYL